jgi:ribonuclease P/MRP protein subunit POP5
MKPLPPTLRQKRRYVLARIVPPWTPILDHRTLSAEVQAAVTMLWGDAGGAEIQPVIVACEQGHAIVRCRRDTEDRLATALATVRRVGEHPVALLTVAT